LLFATSTIAVDVVFVFVVVVVVIIIAVAILHNLLEAFCKQCKQQSPLFSPPYVVPCSVASCKFSLYQLTFKLQVASFSLILVNVWASFSVAKLNPMLVPVIHYQNWTPSASSTFSLHVIVTGDLPSVCLVMSFAYCSSIYKYFL